MTKFNFLLIVLSFAISISCYSQDTITFLNGKTANVKVDSIASDLVYFELVKKKKTKKRIVEAESVFSIKYKDGRDTILYKQDKSRPDSFTEEEMQLYIYGVQDARKGYKNPLTTIISGAAGLGLGYALSDEFLVVTVPFAASVVAGTTGVRYKKNSVRDEKFRKSEAYQEGYFRTARSRKVFNALKGSVLGTLTGVLIGNAVK